MIKVFGDISMAYVEDASEVKEGSCVLYAAVNGFMAIPVAFLDYKPNLSLVPSDGGVVTFDERCKLEMVIDDSPILSRSPEGEEGDRVAIIVCDDRCGEPPVPREL